MLCINCGASMHDAPLFRTQPLGVIPADWKCRKCIDADEDNPPDQETEDIANMLFEVGKEL